MLFALGVSLILACRPSGASDKEEDDNQFREDVIWCEEAVARLERCCPGFDGAQVECRFYFSYEQGCGDTRSERTEPAFTEDDSRCIHDTACSELVANGVCERAAQNGAARSTVTTASSSSGGLGADTTTTTGSPPRSPVCP